MVGSEQVEQNPLCFAGDDGLDNAAAHRCNALLAWAVPARMLSVSSVVFAARMSSASFVCVTAFHFSFHNKASASVFNVEFQHVVCCLTACVMCVYAVFGVDNLCIISHLEEKG